MPMSHLRRALLFTLLFAVACPGIAGLTEGTRLPAELFDSAADTLIENALFKVARGEATRVTAALTAGPQLRICDDGSPVPDTIVGELFRGPVASESGLGVGLYQAAAFAAQSGYALELADNRTGKVCFALSRGR